MRSYWPTPGHEKPPKVGDCDRTGSTSMRVMRASATGAAKPAARAQQSRVFFIVFLRVGQLTSSSGLFDFGTDYGILMSDYLISRYEIAATSREGRSWTSSSSTISFMLQTSGASPRRPRC